MATPTIDRYNSFAIILHWTMAVGFLCMFGIGLVMTKLELSQSLEFKLYQWHKSGGVILFLLLCLRISWRLISGFLKQTPSLPVSFSDLEIIAAKIGHWSLYILMFLMPLTGWLMVSASVYGLPTIVFDLFEWPHIPNLQGDQRIEELAMLTHCYLSIILGVMIAIHIGAVVKHSGQDGKNIMPRIWWASRSRN